MKNYTLYNGDSLKELEKVSDNSIDCIVTDPPYGYSFMGKDWDKTLPNPDIWKQCLRVLKPGAFAFIMSAPRQDVLSRMIINLENSGFNVGFSSIYWAYASGFPKAHNIGKKLEQFNGAYGGFQPKPATEIIIVVMKPLDKKTFVDQCLDNGKGVTWLDNCRVPYLSDSDKGDINRFNNTSGGSFMASDVNNTSAGVNGGRFPANLLVSDNVLDNDFSKYFDLDRWHKELNIKPENSTFPYMIVSKAAKAEKNKGVEDLEGNQHDTGARTYDDICANCKKKLVGDIPHRCQCENKVTEKRITKGNFHPTAKPVKLMQYLITLGSRKGDIILDPFTGSGSTGVAAIQLDREFVGIELSPDYMEIAEKRIKALDDGQETIF